MAYLTLGGIPEISLSFDGISRPLGIQGNPYVPPVFGGGVFVGTYASYIARLGFDDLVLIPQPLKPLPKPFKTGGFTKAIGVGEIGPPGSKDLAQFNTHTFSFGVVPIEGTFFNVSPFEKGTVTIARIPGMLESETPMFGAAFFNQSSVTLEKEWERQCTSAFRIVGDGGSVYTVPEIPSLDPDHIRVTVGGSVFSRTTLTQSVESFEYDGDTLTFASPIAIGAAIELRRITYKRPIVILADSAPMLENDLPLLITQLVYLTEELYDTLVCLA